MFYPIQEHVDGSLLLFVSPRVFARSTNKFNETLRVIYRFELIKIKAIGPARVLDQKAVDKGSDAVWEMIIRKGCGLKQPLSGKLSVLPVLRRPRIVGNR